MSNTSDSRCPSWSTKHWYDPRSTIYRPRRREIGNAIRNNLKRAIRTHLLPPSLLSRPFTITAEMSIPFPVPDATPSFWRTELHPLDTHRTTEELPSECDVLIVGSGYAGVATAYHLLDGQATASQSIVILEAREACSGMFIPYESPLIDHLV